jgi:hypothetical protein
MRLSCSSGSIKLPSTTESSPTGVRLEVRNNTNLPLVDLPAMLSGLRMVVSLITLRRFLGL